MQAIEFDKIVIVTLHLSRCCSTIKYRILPNFCSEDLSVALLLSLHTLFSFQGAIFQHLF